MTRGLHRMRAHLEIEDLLTVRELVGVRGGRVARTDDLCAIAVVVVFVGEIGVPGHSARWGRSLPQPDLDLRPDRQPPHRDSV